MRVGENGHSAVDIEGLWERRHGEILPARVASGTAPALATLIDNRANDGSYFAATLVP